MSLMRTDPRTLARPPWAVLLLGCGLPVGAGAQSSLPQASLEVRSVVSDNSNLSNVAPKTDMSLLLRPSVLWRRQSAGLDLNLNAGINLVGFADHTQPAQSDPFLDAAIKADVVERLLVLDAAASVHNVETEPFSARADTASTANTRRVSRYWLSPQLRHEVSSDCAVGLVGESGWTNYADPAVDDVRANRQRVQVVCEPRPLGYSVEALHEQDSYSLNPLGGWEDTALRLSLNAAVQGQAVLGVVVGTERSQFQGGASRSDALYGLRWAWVPGARTEWRGEVEHRALGTTWDLRFSHRMAASVAVMDWSSGPGDQGPGLASPLGAADLSAMLLALLGSRHADPQERQTAADSLVATRGLPVDTPSAQDLGADYSQRQTQFKLGWMYLGPRTTLTLSAAWLRYQAVSIDGVPQVQTLGAGADSAQRVGLVGVNHLLTPVLSLDATVAWSRVRGLGSRSGSNSDESTGRLTLNHRLSPRTSAFYGVQRQVFNSSVPTLLPFNANSVFVGLKHRF